MKRIDNYIVEKLRINKDIVVNSSLVTSIKEAISDYLLNTLNYKDFTFDYKYFTVNVNSSNLPTNKGLDIYVNYHTRIEDDMEFRKNYFYKVKDIITNDLKLNITSAWTDDGDNGKYPQKIYVRIEY